MFRRTDMEYNFSKKLAELKPSAIREIFKSLSDPTIISFAAGNPCKVIRKITEKDSVKNKPELY
jgi:hypothetical protein